MKYEIFVESANLQTCERLARFLLDDRTDYTHRESPLPNRTGCYAGGIHSAREGKSSIPVLPRFRKGQLSASLVNENVSGLATRSAGRGLRPRLYSIVASARVRASRAAL